MTNDTEIIELVEGAALARKEPKIPRDFITEALERVNSGKEIVERYPTGAPSLKGVYNIASRLYKESTASR